MKSRYILQLAICATALTMACESDSGPLMSSNGFEYEIINSGDGPKCKEGDYAVFNIDLIDDKGEVIQSTKGYPQPPSYEVDRDKPTPAGAPPIEEVVNHMNVGDSAVIYFPVDSMKQNKEQFAGMKTLRYCIKLGESKTQEQIDEDRRILAEEMTAKQEKMREKMTEINARIPVNKARLPEIETMSAAFYDDIQDENVEWRDGPSGLKYYIHEEGTGPIPEDGASVVANYYGYLASDGEMFDTSFRGGREFTFSLGRREVISGWDLGFALLKKGTKATFYIPSDIAYGDRANGGIPPNSDLIFYVELVDTF